MPPNCSRCARWRICTWRRKNCCSWHRLSPGAKVADHGRAAQAGGRPEKTESERLHRPSRTLTTSKTRAYSEFPKRLSQYLRSKITKIPRLRLARDAEAFRIREISVDDGERRLGLQVLLSEVRGSIVARRQLLTNH